VSPTTCVGLVPLCWIARHRSQHAALRVKHRALRRIQPQNDGGGGGDVVFDGEELAGAAARSHAKVVDVPGVHTLRERVRGVVVDQAKKSITAAIRSVFKK
jgi:hypothetical protein